MSSGRVLNSLNASLTQLDSLAIFAVHAWPSAVSSSNSYCQMISSGTSSPSRSLMVGSPISAHRTMSFWNGVMLSMSSSISGWTYAVRPSIMAWGWFETARSAMLRITVWPLSRGLMLFAILSIASCIAVHSPLPVSASYAASKSPVPSNRVKFSIALNDWM